MSDEDTGNHPRIDDQDQKNSWEENGYLEIDDTDYEYEAAVAEWARLHHQGVNIPQIPFSIAISNRVKSLPKDDAIDLIKQECEKSPYEIHRRMAHNHSWVSTIYNWAIGLGFD